MLWPQAMLFLIFSEMIIRFLHTDTILTVSLALLSGLLVEVICVVCKEKLEDPWVFHPISLFSALQNPMIFQAEADPFGCMIT